MAKSISLSVYSITINKSGDKSDLAILSDFNNGYDFLSDLDTMINGWKRNDGQGDKDDPITKTEERAFRLARKDQNTYYCYRAGRYISCMIESGEYGTEEDGVNVDTGEKSFEKKKRDALLKPFFFELFIPMDSKYGFLIIERISNTGIFSVLSAFIKKMFDERPYSEDYVLQIRPLSVNKLVDQRMKALKYEAKKIEFNRVKKEDIKLSKLSNQQVDDSKVRMSIIYSAPINGIIKLKEYIKTLSTSWNKEEQLYKIDEDMTCDEVKVLVDIDGQEKTLSLQHIEKLGMSMEISKTVLYGQNGYPTFDSVKQQADILVSYIIQQISKNQDEKD